MSGAFLPVRGNADGGRGDAGGGRGNADAAGRGIDAINNRDGTHASWRVGWVGF